MTVGAAPPATPVRGNMGSAQPGSLWKRMGKYRWCYLFVLPNLVLAGALTLYPTIASWWYSFLDWDGFSWGAEFIGLDNYVELAADSQFWAAFGRAIEKGL